ncbi:MAG: hypothetical protein KF767_14750 [Bdellovibrionaceae bacterium]|nr:hypothetical protein [Pseudobdellovibrionaceae bacterium]
MGIEKLIPIALGLAITAVASGRLSNVILELRIAQLRLLKEAQSSNWGKPMLLPVQKKNLQK